MGAFLQAETAYDDEVNESYEQVDDKKATLDFIKWMVTDDSAKKILSQDMGFSVPFTTFTDKFQPNNPLTAAARAINAPSTSRNTASTHQKQPPASVAID